MGLGERLRALEAVYSPSGDRGPAAWSPHHDGQRNAQNLGGDKARTNGYAPAYDELLSDRDPKVLVELGVFRGTSLAVWCDLFPMARVVGLDISIEERMDYEGLIERGAFARNMPKLLEWDAYDGQADEVATLAGAPIDIFVDDGPHTKTAILRVAELMAPLMAVGGCYIVEDHEDGARFLKATFPDAEIRRYGRLNAALL